MQVVVGSLTHSKIEATRRAFQWLLPSAAATLQVRGVSVASGVAAMPLTNDELREGAINRVIAAQELVPQADYYVGIEGGFATEFDQTFCAGWYAVVSQGRMSVGRSMSFLVPDEIAHAVVQGEELGAVVERYSAGTAKRGTEGLIGLLTGGRYTRVDYDTQGLIAALCSLQWELDASRNLKLGSSLF